MKIALVAPLQEAVPPKGYGGIEQVLCDLADGLVKRGHDVTLFARAESQTSAKLISLGIDAKQVEQIEDRYIAGYNLSCKVAEMSDQFDIINNHAGWRFLIFAPKMKAPVVNSYHNLFAERFHSLLKLYKEYPYTSISLDQQNKAPKEIEFVRNIYNSIDESKFSFKTDSEDFLFWMARIVIKKGAYEAIQVAKATGKKLVLAGPLVTDRPEEEQYFKEKVEPYIDNKQIFYIGPADHAKKVELYGKALAFLNPIDWDEPFGLVVPEANATGTPVIAFNRGAMSELIVEGKNGFLVKGGDIDSMASRVKEISAMGQEEYRSLRKSSRQHFEENFTIQKMINGYEEAYEKVINRKK